MAKLPPHKKSAKVSYLTPPAAHLVDGRVDAGSSHSATERYELPPIMTRALLYVLGALFIVGLLWSALSSVDIVAEGPGQLVPKGKVKMIQPMADGMIENVLVQEGQKVKAGDKLLLLERTPYAAEVNKQQQELEIARSELEQLKQAKSALESVIANPGVVPAIKVEVGNIGKLIGDLYSSNIALQEARLDCSDNKTAASASSSDMAAVRLRLVQLQNEKTAQERTLASRRQEYKDRQVAQALEVAAQVKALEGACSEQLGIQSILAKTQEQEAAYRQVFEQGAVSRVDYLNVVKEVEREKTDLVKQECTIAELTKRVQSSKAAERQLRNQTHAELSALEAQIKRLSAEITAVEMQVRDNERRYKLARGSFEAALSSARGAMEQLEADISQKQHRVSQLQSALQAAQQAFDEAEIEAPIDGTVTGIVARGKGQVVKKGESLMTVVPADASLVVEACVSNKDIGFVEKGQEAKLKFAAFPYQEYGVVRGKVSEIELHSQDDPKLGSVYKVTIIPERNWIMGKGRKIPFMSGLAVTAEIIVRKRSVLDICLEPIQKMSDTSWK